MKDLKERVKKLKNINFKKIMYRLINIYLNECRFNEGDLGFSDLCEILFILESVDFKIEVLKNG